MSDSGILDSLPDRQLKTTEVNQFQRSDAIEWSDPLRTGFDNTANMASAVLIQANGTVYVLLYELDGWAVQGSFDADGLVAEEKRDRGEEILDG